MDLQPVDSPVVQQELMAAPGISLPEVARRASVSPETAWRWATRGVSRGGRTVRLEAARVGCRWRTTEAAFARFMSRSTGAPLPTVEGGELPAIGGRTPARALEVARAVDELRQLGVG